MGANARLTRLLLLACFLTGIALALWGVEYPYVGIYNANNNYLALASKNFLRFGFVQTHFLPTYFAGRNLPAPPPLYLHHPVLDFLLIALPFAVFGSANWVVHATAFVYMLAAFAMLYMLAAEVWGRKTAAIAVVLASLFPMQTFFWKYQFFEQPTLFWNLAVVYAYVRYLKTGTRRWLSVIAGCALISTLTDWYGAYLVFPMAYMLLTPDARRTRTALLYYAAAVAAGIAAFVGTVWLTSRNLHDLADAVLSRSVGTELYSMRFWPIRLGVITAVRSVLFFTPVPFAGIAYLTRSRQEGGAGFRLRMLRFLLILGLVNIVFLPTATWGHSYFLYFLIPFFAVSGGLVLSRLKQPFALAALAGVAVWSFLITGLKLQEVRKQIWKYDFSTQIAATVPKYEGIGVLNFPGDVLQNYWFIPADPMNTSELRPWAEGKLYPGYRYVVYVCAGSCTDQELMAVEDIRPLVTVRSYLYGKNPGWILVRGSGASASPQDTVHVFPDRGEIREGFAVSLYRKVRDSIGGMQL